MRRRGLTRMHASVGAGRLLTVCLLACGPASPPTDAASRTPPSSASQERAPLSAIARAHAEAESTYYRSEFDSARSAFQAVLSAADAAGDSVSRGRALTWLGLTDHKQAHYESARTIGEEALAFKLRQRLTRELPASYIALGLTAYYEGPLRGCRHALPLRARHGNRGERFGRSRKSHCEPGPGLD